MNSISNLFSILHLDAEDDKEQIASLSVAKDETHAKKSGWFFLDLELVNLILHYQADKMIDIWNSGLL